MIQDSNYAPGQENIDNIPFEEENEPGELIPENSEDEYDSDGSKINSL